MELEEPAAGKVQPLQHDGSAAQRADRLHIEHAAAFGCMDFGGAGGEQERRRVSRDHHADPETACGGGLNSVWFPDLREGQALLNFAILVKL